MSVAKEISVLLASHGFSRDVAGVLDKINRIHSTCMKAKDWERQTGAGLRKNAQELVDMDPNNPDYANQIAENEVHFSISSNSVIM